LVGKINSACSAQTILDSEDADAAPSVELPAARLAPNFAVVSL
jgi:hypothetical protein